MGAGAGGTAPVSRFELPFFHDEYGKALADARAKGRPMFVDVWATWCHTCLSLKSFVLTDPALREHQDAFTWLSIDSEKPENAALVERWGLQVLPTLWILDAASEKAMWSWKGALTTDELKAALGDLRGKRDEARDTLVRAALALAESDVAAKRIKEATKRYRALLADPSPFPERGRAADAFVSLLSDAKSFDECATTAHREGPRLPLGTFRVDLAVTGVGCVSELKSASAQKLLPDLMRELTVVTTSAGTAILDDDRSSAFDALVSAQKSAKDEDGAKKTAAAWATFLESTASRATTPRERAVFDAHRLGAYLELGEPGRALPMLEASERDFPDDYNPSARRARALMELGRHDEALAAADRALARAYGGRRLRIYILKADIFDRKKAPEQARATLQAALADAKEDSLRASYQRLLQSIRERLHRSAGAASR